MDAEKTVYRHEVPIDDGPQRFMLNHMPLAVQSNPDSEYVEFWVEHSKGDPEHLVEHTFQVFGTGDSIPESAEWIGTCQRNDVGEVWHLYEIR